ncbi:MAG: hypothetical protein JWN34_4491 [Bryobacterales bacterium]|nr:hypothetical protein [Bryobacterales bacterium]
MESASPTTTPAARLRETAPKVTTPRSSVALRRLMDEVRFEEATGSPAGMAYDRAHNRHNRS